MWSIQVVKWWFWIRASPDNRTVRTSGVSEKCARRTGVPRHRFVSSSLIKRVQKTMFSCGASSPVKLDSVPRLLVHAPTSLWNWGPFLTLRDLIKMRWACSPTVNIWSECWGHWVLTAVQMGAMLTFRTWMNQCLHVTSFLEVRFNCWLLKK